MIEGRGYALSGDTLRVSDTLVRLSAVDWYSWRDTPATVEALCDFCRHSGLFGVAGAPKPAWSAFRRLAAG